MNVDDELAYRFICCSPCFSHMPPMSPANTCITCVIDAKNM